jgi:uncharacterized protein (UPF0303 family)
MHDRAFLNHIKKNLPELKKLLKEVNGHWYYEDLVYRFYHSSYKVFYVQTTTKKIVKTLNKLAPKGCVMNEYFKQIFEDGTIRRNNRDWLKRTRPMLEAFFHAKYFLEMSVKYGKELEKAPRVLPSGWAGLLYLFNLR